MDEPVASDEEEGSDPLAALCRLEQSVQQRAEDLQRDMAQLQEARRELARREAEQDLRRWAEEDLEAFEEFLHSKVEAALAQLDQATEPARRECDEVSESVETCASELQRLRDEVVARLESLGEAASRCEEEIERAADTTLQEWRRRRSEQVALELRLAVDGLRTPGVRPAGPAVP